MSAKQPKPCPCRERQLLAQITKLKEKLNEKKKPKPKRFEPLPKTPDHEWHGFNSSNMVAREWDEVEANEWTHWPKAGDAE